MGVPPFQLKIGPCSDQTFALCYHFESCECQSGKRILGIALETSFPSL